MRPVRALGTWLFVLASALITVVSSERIFWYYTDAEPLAFAELAAFYGVGMYWLLVCVQRYRVDRFRAFLLAVPLFAYVVEGIVTPVVYSGGPNPFFPVWFTGWHGLLGPVLLWYLFRRWLVEGRWRAILGASIGLGAFWGTWATSMWLPESLNDPELAESEPAIRSALDFAGYAASTGAALILGHLVVDRVWRRVLPRSRTVEIVLAVLCAAMLGLWTVAYPWAIPMFAVLVASVVVPLRRHRRLADAPTILDQLAGPIAPAGLAAMTALPAVAAVVHALWLAVEPGEDAVRAFFYGTIGLQTVVAGTVLVWAWVATWRAVPGDTAVRSGRSPARA